MRLNIDVILSIVETVAIVLVATILHEMAHAGMAYALGDPTAKERGRLTLNPAAHLDPVGSILLPVLMAAAGGPIFAFAKPVPYNPARLKNPVRDEVLVALAGPACNLLQAIVGSIAFRAVLEFGLGGEHIYTLLEILSSYVYLNLMLMFFNLIPLPPLDGSAIVSPLLKGKARQSYYTIQHYAMPVLLVLLFVVPSIVGFDPIGWYLHHTAGTLVYVMLGV